MTVQEKLKMAVQLEKLGADIIEAGFPAASPGDRKSVKLISEALNTSTVAALARLNKDDIDAAWEAVQNAKHPRLHVFIATSDIHLEYKLKLTRPELIEKVRTFVTYAKSLCSDLEFSAEDATRSDRDFLLEVYREAARAGATVLNIPDTVGYATPQEMTELVTLVHSDPELKELPLSVHCHNDLGLAVSNSLAAVKAGVTQVECTVNGIGERAGNAALEEIAMNLYVRPEFYGASTGINTKEIMRTSRLLSMLTGVKVQPNKAITGANAFAHEAGIHQHGIMANRATYEIIAPETVGLTENRIILGKHSGRHAFEEKLVSMGIVVNHDQLNDLFDKFKVLADKKKTVTDKDIEALLKDTVMDIPEIYKLDRYIINSSNMLSSTCSVRLLRDGKKTPEGSAMAGGPIEAAFNAINTATGLDLTLSEYKIEAVTAGIDAQGAVSVRVRKDGHSYKGYGVDPNIIEASIKAYVNAINNMIHQTEKAEAEAETGRGADQK